MYLPDGSLDPNYNSGANSKYAGPRDKYSGAFGSYRGEVKGITEYYQAKVNKANAELPGDQAELERCEQEYQTFSAQAASYECSLAQKLRNCHNVYESLEKRLANTHNPKEVSELRKWLNQEASLDAQARRDLAVVETSLSREKAKVQAAAHNVSEDEQASQDYTRVQYQSR